MKITKKWLRTAALWLVFLPGMAAVFFPLYITVVNALKTPSESSKSFFSLPGSLYMGNFLSILRENNFFTYISNTVVILVLVIAVEMVITPIAAYAISRNQKSPYFKAVYLFIVCGIFVPFQVRMIPLVQMMSKLHLMNRAGMFFLYLAATAPQAIFLIVGYLKSISPEIEEAAVIDGCSPLRTYFAVVFPLMKPILATLLIKDSLFIWNDFQLPLIILNKTKEYWTLQLFQYNFKSQYAFDFNLAFASFLLTILPQLVLYVFMQKHIVSGLSAGAVKG